MTDTQERKISTQKPAKVQTLLLTTRKAKSPYKPREEVRKEKGANTMEPLSRESPEPTTKPEPPYTYGMEPLSTRRERKLPSNGTSGTTGEPAAAGVHQETTTPATPEDPARTPKGKQEAPQLKGSPVSPREDDRQGRATGTPGPRPCPQNHTQEQPRLAGEKADHKQARQPEGATWTQAPAAPQQ